jgi:hypothetical protein
MSTFHSPSTSTLKSEVAQPSKMLVSNHHTTWCNNPENQGFQFLFITIKRLVYQFCSLRNATILVTHVSSRHDCICITCTDWTQQVLSTPNFLSTPYNPLKYIILITMTTTNWFHTELPTPK